MFLPQSSPSPSFILHRGCKYFVEKMRIVSRSYGEEHQFIHLEPSSGNSAFPPALRAAGERCKGRCRQGLTLPPMGGLPESLPLPSPTLSAGGAGENAGVSNGKRAGSRPASCSKSAEPASLSLPDRRGGALGHGVPAERRWWGSFRPLRVSNLEGRGTGCNGLAGLSSLILNATSIPFQRLLATFSLPHARDCRELRCRSAGDVCLLRYGSGERDMPSASSGRSQLRYPGGQEAHTGAGQPPPSLFPLSIEALDFSVAYLRLAA